MRFTTAHIGCRDHMVVSQNPHAIPSNLLFYKNFLDFKDNIFIFVHNRNDIFRMAIMNIAIIVRLRNLNY